MGALRAWGSRESWLICRGKAAEEAVVTAGSAEEVFRALPIALAVVTAVEFCSGKEGRREVRGGFCEIGLTSEAPKKKLETLAGRRPAKKLAIARAGRSVIGSASGHLTT